MAFSLLLVALALPSLDALSPLSSQAKSTPVVCLDPGHPSEVHDGSEVLNGLKEVEINWKIAVMVGEKLRAAGLQVVMTKRSVGERVNNQQRAAKANASRADLFLRLHADAGGGSGFTIYYPRKQGTVNGKTGPSQAVITASASAARQFHAGVKSKLAGRLKDNGIRGDEQSFVGGKQGAFTGSIYSTQPVLLFEMCFLDNRKDADWIRQSANQVLMAEAIVVGTLTYLRRQGG